MCTGPIPVYSDVEAHRSACDDARARGQRVAIVPTMGALHDGHLTLIREACRHAEHVVVSVFVNPTQFAPGEDLDAYPRCLDSDVEGCRRAGASCVFAPGAVAMYPEGEQTRVRVLALADQLCGRSRPGHFEGVATIVAKLLIITGACVAVFGRKDYQQLKIIERVSKDLFLPVTIIGHPTVREPDGLAMSSRNRYLSSEQRHQASAIPRGLRHAMLAFHDGERRVSALRAAVVDGAGPLRDAFEYVEVANADTLHPFGSHETIPNRAVLACAVRVGTARLIDNVVLGEDNPPGEEAT